VDNDTHSEKPSALNLSRLYGGSHKKASGRPTTTDGMPTRELSDKKEKEKKPRNNTKDSRDEPGSPSLLRKRATSGDDMPTRSMQVLKPGQSVLQQIGEPDHKGWMRKKGDRYNSWKSRYFVLKGPHLYYLKSDDFAVSGHLRLRTLVLKPFGCAGNQDPGIY
jgi:hypothetical protein